MSTLFTCTMKSNGTTDGLLVCLVSIVQLLWRRFHLKVETCIETRRLCHRCSLLWAFQRGDLDLLTRTITFTVLLSPMDGVITHILLAPMSHKKQTDSEPQPAISTRYVSASWADGFTLVSVLTSSRSAACLLRPAPAVQSLPEQICRTSLPGGCWSTTQKFSWILHRADRKSRTEWLRDYYATPAVNSTAPWRIQNATGGGCRTVEQNQIEALTQRTRIWWNLGVRGSESIRERRLSAYCCHRDKTHNSSQSSWENIQRFTAPKKKRKKNRPGHEALELILLFL